MTVEDPDLQVALVEGTTETGRAPYALISRHGLGPFIIAEPRTAIPELELTVPVASDGPVTAVVWACPTPAQSKLKMNSRIRIERYKRLSPFGPRYSSFQPGAQGQLSMVAVLFWIADLDQWFKRRRCAAALSCSAF